MTSPGIEAKSYGKDAGYSVDHGAPSKSEMAITNDNYGYGATGQTNGTGGAAAAPVNPFTQQQYQEQRSTNPFAK